MANTPEDVEDERVGRSTTSAPPSATPPPTAPPLRRRANGRIVAGVAGGLADRWRLPAWLVRIPFALAAFVDAMLVWRAFDTRPWIGGILGISGRLALSAIAAAVAYVALWWLVPREDVGVSLVGRGVRRFAITPVRSFTSRYPGVRSWPGLAALAFGGALLASRFGIWDPAVAIALVLIVIGLMLYRRGPAASGAGDATRTEPPPTPPSDEAPMAVEPWRPRPPRERSPFAWIVFGSALLVGAVSSIALQARAGEAYRQAAWIDRVSTPPALALLVLGVGLVISSLFGRARWNTLPAVLLVPIVLVASTIRLPLWGRYGDTVANVHPYDEVVSFRSTAGKIYANYSSFAGRDDIDRFPIEGTTVVGDISIGLPYDASYRVTAHAGIGSVAIGGGRFPVGVETSRTYRYRSPIRGGPSFVIRAETGIGNIDVFRTVENRAQARELRKAERAAA
jgi:phage shock protein PspC (stress-responsive transcriptional regulator)